MADWRREGYKMRGVVVKPGPIRKLGPKRRIAPTLVIAGSVRNRKPKGSIPRRKELKFVDVAAATYVGDTTGTITLLNGIAVGDDFTTRDGRQVTIKSVQVRGRVGPVDAGMVFNKSRLLLVWDNAANGAAATIADVLNAASSQSFPLVNNANRFTILVDRPFTIGGFDTTATQAYSMAPACHDIEIYKRIDSVTQYSGTGATIASVQNGALYMITIGDVAAGLGSVFGVTTRVRFCDD